MFDLQKILQKKKKNERGSLSINKFFDEIQSTKEYSSKTLYDLDIQEKVFKQSFLNKILMLIVLFALLVFFFIKAISVNSPTIFYSFGMLICIALIGSVIYNGFINSEQNFEILLNSDFIEINNEKYYWKNIEETAIYTQRNGKTCDSYLILSTSETNYQKFLLNGFNPFGINRFCTRLSNYIEYFKNLK